MGTKQGRSQPRFRLTRAEMWRVTPCWWQNQVSDPEDALRSCVFRFQPTFPVGFSTTPPANLRSSDPKLPIITQTGRGLPWLCASEICPSVWNVLFLSPTSNPQFLLIKAYTFLKAPLRCRASLDSLSWRICSHRTVYISAAPIPFFTAQKCKTLRKPQTSFDNFHADFFWWPHLIWADMRLSFIVSVKCYLSL